MTLLPVPAHAGTWQFSGSGSGTAHAEDAYYGPWDLAPWTAPDPSNNSYTIPSYGYPIIQPGSYGPGATVSRDVNITVTITGKWIPDPNLASDPAPTSVWLIESSSAEWEAKYIDRDGTHAGSSSGSNDLGDKPVPTIVNGVTVGGYVDSKNAPVTTPPAHWFVQKVNGNSFTLPLHTFTAKGSFTIPTSSSGGTVSFGARFDGYTLSVHAQPYNFRQVGDPIDSDNGTVTFNYAWSSTSGALTGIDNTTCAVYEIVTYPGTPGTLANPVAYVPPNPPFGPGWAYDASGNPNFPNPTINAAQANSGSGNDTQKCYNSWTMPYSNTPWTATQNWYFDDSLTGQSKAPIPGSVANPLSITRSVGSRLMYTPTYWYSLTKGSFTGGWVALPGQ